MSFFVQNVRLCVTHNKGHRGLLLPHILSQLNWCHHHALFLSEIHFNITIVFVPTAFLSNHADSRLRVQIIKFLAGFLSFGLYVLYIHVSSSLLCS
jgi:hypothetical protein